MLAHSTREIREYFMTIVQPYLELRPRQGLHDHPFRSNFIFFLCHTHLSTYSVSFVNVRRLMRRIAFFFSMRRCSLLETNQRLRRTVLNTPLLTTFLRKRLSKESWDSPFRKFTPANEIHLLYAWNSNKKSAGMQTRP